MASAESLEGTREGKGNGSDALGFNLSGISQLTPSSGRTRVESRRLDDILDRLNQIGFGNERGNSRANGRSRNGGVAATLGQTVDFVDRDATMEYKPPRKWPKIAGISAAVAAAVALAVGVAYHAGGGKSADPQGQAAGTQEGTAGNRKPDAAVGADTTKGLQQQEAAKTGEGPEPKPETDEEVVQKLKKLGPIQVEGIDPVDVTDADKAVRIATKSSHRVWAIPSRSQAPNGYKGVAHVMVVYSKNQVIVFVPNIGMKHINLQTGDQTYRGFSNNQHHDLKDAVVSVCYGIEFDRQKFQELPKDSTASKLNAEHVSRYANQDIHRYVPFALSEPELKKISGIEGK